MYHDAIAGKPRPSSCKEIDGMGSDGQAVFICAATNRVDHVDSAMLSRFAERIEIPLPDEPTRRALLEVFLGAMRFVGDRQHAIETLAKSSDGHSGRDLRNLVNAAVLAAVKRTSSPKDFALTVRTCKARLLRQPRMMLPRSRAHRQDSSWIRKCEQTQLRRS